MGPKKADKCETAKKLPQKSQNRQQIRMCRKNQLLATKKCSNRYLDMQASKDQIHLLIVKDASPAVPSNHHTGRDLKNQSESGSEVWKESYRSPSLEK